MMRVLFTLTILLLNTHLYAHQGLPRPDFNSVHSCSQDMLSDAYIAGNHAQYSHYFKNTAVTKSPNVYIKRNKNGCELIYDTVSLCRLMGPYDNEPVTNTTDVYSMLKPMLSANIVEQINHFNQGSPFNGGKSFITVKCKYSCNEPIQPNYDCSYEMA